MSRHDVMFMYVGATSPLKVKQTFMCPSMFCTPAHTRLSPVIFFQGNYTLAAEELIIHTYFFSGTRDILPKVRTAQH